jgi:hypothetical protein
MGFLDTIGKVGSAFSPFISAGVGLFNTIAGSNSAKKQNEENRRWQAEQNTLAYERQKELTMLSPQLQKQGLQAAGISTAALNGYTGGTASVNAANSAPSPQSEFIPFDINSVLNAISVESQKKLNDSAADVNEAKANQIKKESGRYDELTDATIAKIKSDIEKNDRSIQLDGATIREINAKIPILNNQAEYWNFLASNEDISFQKNSATYQAEIDSLKAQFKLNEEQAKTRLRYIDRVVDAEYKLLLANIYNARASGQSQLSNAYTNRLQYELDNSFKDLRSELLRWQTEDVKQNSFNKEKEGRYYGIDKETQIMLRNKLIDKFNIDNQFAPYEKTLKMIGDGVDAATSLTPAKRIKSVVTNSARSRYGSRTTRTDYDYE